MRKLLLALVFGLLTLTPCFAQQGVHSKRFTIAGPDSAINLINTAIAWHKLTWSVSGTASVCTVALDTSTNGTTWSAGGAIAGQTCTSNGSSSVVNVSANYVRINMTALTDTAGSSVTVTWDGYTSSPSGGGSVTGCTSSGGVLYENGTSNTATCSADFHRTAATGTVSVVPPNNNASTAIFGDNVATTLTNTFGIQGEGESTLNSPSTNTGNVIGLYAKGGVIGTGTWSGIVGGVESETFSNGNSVIAEVDNFVNTVHINEAGTPAITNMYSFHAVPQTLGSSKNVGFYADDFGSAANSYAFYSVGGQNQLNLGSSQTLPIFDVKAANATTPYGGAVVVRGDGLGMVPIEGEPALLEIVQHDSNTVGFVLSSGDAPAGNSMDITMASDGHTNWTHSIDGSEFDFMSFNADGSQESHPASGKGFKSPQFAMSTSGNGLIFDTAPTVSSGFGTSAAITANNGTAAFRISVGTSNTGTGVIGLPTAATGWNCYATDITTTSTTVSQTKQKATGSDSTHAALQNYTDISGTAVWVDNDVLAVSCFAY